MMGIGPLGIMLALAGIILLIAGLAQAAQNRSYAACSEKTAAKVTNKTSRRTKNGRAYELFVSYTADGNAYEKWIGVNADTFGSVGVGDRYEILYKPQDPKRAVSPGTLAPKNARVVLILGAVLTACGAAMYLLAR